MHPVNAFNLIYPIKYLRDALDIPYCHHEKWDGSGYPRGLKGDEIPLAARIFAFADVWDAMTSDRYYRAALPEAEVRDYFLQNRGKHFDPLITDIFLNMMK
jgi:HD-GYP domain-containing protein (c-di-GMP phosphodiesterase class II)